MQISLWDFCNKYTKYVSFKHSTEMDFDEEGSDFILLLLVA